MVHNETMATVQGTLKRFFRQNLLEGFFDFIERFFSSPQHEPHRAFSAPHSSGGNRLRVDAEQNFERLDFGNDRAGEGV